jgi:hypothetical protein
VARVNVIFQKFTQTVHVFLDTLPSQFKKTAKDASALVIIRFYQYRKLALLQQTWFAKNDSASASGRSRGRHGAMAINMAELRASRISYKKSLANLKNIVQALCICCIRWNERFVFDIARYHLN